MFRALSRCTPVGFVDLVHSGEQIAGLLLVGAHRDDEIDPAHPLAAPLSRWCAQADVRHLRLDNLPVSGSVTVIAEMVKVDPANAAGLLGIIGPHTSGNPYETVELLNGPRCDGLLTASADRWRWDEAAVRVHLGQSEPGGLPAARSRGQPKARAAWPARSAAAARSCALSPERIVVPRRDPSRHLRTVGPGRR